MQISRIYGLPHGRDDVGRPRLAAGAAHDSSAGVEHEHGRRTPDVQAPNQLQVGLGVDLDVTYAGDLRGDIGKHAPRSPARLAEGGRKLDERGPFAEGPAEITGRQNGGELRRAAPRTTAQPVPAASHQDAHSERHGDGYGQRQKALHANRNGAAAASIPRPRAPP